jgi:hypothetical protein
MKRYPQLLRYPQGIVTLGSGKFRPADRVGMAFDAKSGKKIDALNIYTLLLKHSNGQHGIKTTGYQGKRAAFFVHRKNSGEIKRSAGETLPDTVGLRGIYEIGNNGSGAAILCGFHSFGHNI